MKIKLQPWHIIQIFYGAIVVAGILFNLFNN